MDYKEVLQELDEMREKVLTCIELEKKRLQERIADDALDNYQDILYICSRIGRVGVIDLQSTTRLAEVNKVRQVYCYLMCKNTNLTIKAIGEKVNRKYNTVISSRDTVKQEIDQYYKSKYDPRGTVGLVKAICSMTDLHY